MATKHEPLYVAGVKMSKMSQMLFLIFSLIHIVTYGAEVSIFGPQTITASPSKVKSTFQVSAETTSQVAGSIFIKNGNGSDLLLQNCSGLKGQQKKSCAAANQSTEDSATDRPSDFFIKWNGITIADSKSLPWFKGYLLVPVQVQNLSELVVDRKGANGSSLTVTVNANLPNQNQQPTAAFSFTPEFPVGPQLISFNGILSSDSDGQVVSYEWDFGDGSFGSGAFATHLYASSGIFQVKLTVTDNGAATASTIKNLEISSLPQDTIAPIISTNLAAFYEVQQLGGQTQILIQTNEPTTYVTVNGINAVKVNDTNYIAVLIFSTTGPKSLEFKSADLAGNIATLQQVTEIRVDSVPPIILATVPEYTKQSDIIISVVITDESETRTEIKLDGILIDTVSEKNFSYLISLGEDGEKNLEIKTTDAVGNVIVSTSLIVKDNSPLLVQFVSPQSGSIYSSNVVEVKISSTKYLKEVFVNNVSVPVSERSKTVTYYTQIPTEGFFTVNATANDQFGGSASISVQAEIKLNSVASWNYQECAAE